MKLIKLLIFVFLLNITLNVNAQEQFKKIELTEENRYNPEYNMTIFIQEEEQLDKVGNDDQEVLGISELEDLLVDAWSNFETKIDLSDYYILAENNILHTYYFQILSKYPEFFYVENSIVINVYDEYVSKIMIYYSMEKSEAKAIQQQMDLAVEDALNRISDDMEDYEKALVIHDWLINHCKYDYENYLNSSIPDASYSAYGALAYGIAVCDGYTKAYQYIMNKYLEIPCYRVVSYSMQHAWNLIKIDGQYYHIDVTWDDPVIGTNNPKDQIGYIKHNNFLLSDIGITNTGHSDWKISATATSTLYDENIRWKDIKGQIIYYNEKWYYVDNSLKAIVSTDNIINGEITIIYNIEPWMTTFGKYWTDTYSYPQIYKNRLIFNGPQTIYSMNFDTNIINELVIPENNDNFKNEIYNIYGFDIKNDKLRYLFSSTPILSGEEIIYEMTIPSLGILNGNISIVGETKYGNTLSINVLSCSESIDKLQFQWYRNDRFIQGANKSSYTLTKADIDTEISVKISTSNYLGTLTAKTNKIEKADVPAPLENINLSGYRGQKLQDIPLPEGYKWEDTEVILIENGIEEYNIIYCPDEKLFNPVYGLKATVNIKYEYQKGDIKIIFSDPNTGNIYQLNKINDLDAEVSFIGHEDKEKEQIIIPDVLKYENMTVKITSIEKNALANNEYLKSIIIGKNITFIGKNAFLNCKNLKTIHIKTTQIKKFGKNCIKNIHKKAVIKCPKDYKKKYKSKLTKKTGFTKQMKIK